MRILLDSNVWRYLLKQNAAARLVDGRWPSCLRFVVAPAVIYEALRCKDAVLRGHLTELLTRSTWERLPSDISLEAEDLLTAFRKFRSPWVRHPMDLRTFRLLRRDWRGRRGGFWERARGNPDKESSLLRANEGVMVEIARKSAACNREALSAFPMQARDKPVATFKATPRKEEPGWRGEPIDAWRLDGKYWVEDQFYAKRSALREWLEGRVEFERALADALSWNEFWLNEVKAADLPRMWLRTACGILQGFHRVNDGTPVDAQIAVHFTDVDVFVSADRRFVEMAKRLRAEAPFDVAEPFLIGGDQRSTIDELVAIARSVQETRI